MFGMGHWKDERGSNLLDTGAPFYDTYETADGRYVAIAAIEPQFYRQFRQRAGLLEDADLDRQLDRSTWPAMRAKLTALFRSRTQSQWCALFEGSDACIAPVLSLSDAPSYEHNQDRGAFVLVGGLLQPAPAPRYSHTPTAKPAPPPGMGRDSRAILHSLGYEAAQIEALLREQVVAADEPITTSPDPSA
jgi:alpha-methylacyl-CoA racemase